MSSNSHHFPPNYYVQRNIDDPYWYDNIEDLYLRDFYDTAETNYYYYQPTSGYIDDQFPFVESTNSQSCHIYNGQSSFVYINEPYLWDYVYNEPSSEFIDGVYVLNHHRNIGDQYFAPFNLDHNSAFTGLDHTYNGQSSFDHIGDPYVWDEVYNQQIGEFINSVSVTTEFTDDDSDTTESGFSTDDDDADDIAYLTGLLGNLVTYEEGSEDEEEEDTEEIIGNMMKTRIYCNTDDGGEICVICQCEYENDETIGTLECQHEYHAGCIKEWLLLGKRSCPICRSSVLPS